MKHWTERSDPRRFVYHIVLGREFHCPLVQKHARDISTKVNANPTFQVLNWGSSATLDTLCTSSSGAFIHDDSSKSAVDSLVKDGNRERKLACKEILRELSMAPHRHEETCGSRAFSSIHSSYACKIRHSGFNKPAFSFSWGSWPGGIIVDTDTPIK